MELTKEQIKQIEELFGLQFREETDSFYRWFSNGQELYIKKRFLDRGYLDAYVKNGNQLMGLPIKLIEPLSEILSNDNEIIIKKATKAQKDYILSMCEKDAYGIPRKNYMTAINNIETMEQARAVILDSQARIFRWVDEYMLKDIVFEKRSK